MMLVLFALFSVLSFAMSAVMVHNRELDNFVLFFVLGISFFSFSLYEMNYIELRIPTTTCN